MIRSFADRTTQRLFEREGRVKFPKQLQRVALRKLLILHAAVSLDDLRPRPETGWRN